MANRSGHITRHGGPAVKNRARLAVYLPPSIPPPAPTIPAPITPAIPARTVPPTMPPAVTMPRRRIPNRPPIPATIHRIPRLIDRGRAIHATPISAAVIPAPRLHHTPGEPKRDHGGGHW